MDGAMMEIGPYRVQKDGTLTYNDGSWDEFANLLFVDNPVGTGFSYVDTDSYVHELKDMADQMVKFLEKFFSLFPEYANDDVSVMRQLPTISPALTKYRSYTLLESRTRDNISHTLRRLYWIGTHRQWDPNGISPALL